MSKLSISKKNHNLIFPSKWARYYRDFNSQIFRISKSNRIVGILFIPILKNPLDPYQSHDVHMAPLLWAHLSGARVGWAHFLLPQAQMMKVAVATMGCPQVAWVYLKSMQHKEGHTHPCELPHGMGWNCPRKSRGFLIGASPTPAN